MQDFFKFNSCWQSRDCDPIAFGSDGCQKKEFAYYHQNALSLAQNLGKLDVSYESLNTVILC